MEPSDEAAARVDVLTASSGRCWDRGTAQPLGDSQPQKLQDNQRLLFLDALHLDIIPYTVTENSYTQGNGVAGDCKCVSVWVTLEKSLKQTMLSHQDSEINVPRDISLWECISENCSSY